MLWFVITESRLKNDDLKRQHNEGGHEDEPHRRYLIIKQIKNSNRVCSSTFLPFQTSHSDVCMFHSDAAGSALFNAWLRLADWGKTRHDWPQEAASLLQTSATGSHWAAETHTGSQRGDSCAVDKAAWCGCGSVVVLAK